MKKFLSSYFFILLPPFLLLSPMLFTGKSLFWGTPSLQFVPWWWQAWEQVRLGLFPLWNPLNGMGAPLLANYQMAFFYPINWVLLPLAGLFGPPGIAWGYTVLSAIHLVWAGLGMAYLVKQLGYGSLSQNIAGLSFGLSGYLVGRLGFYSMIWASAWLPWVLFCIERLVTGKSKDYFPPIGLTACITMQMLAGHAQITWYSCMLYGAWFFMVIWRESIWKLFLLKFIGFLGGVILAVSIAMIQLAPTFVYLLQSHRANEVGYEEAMRYSFWPWRFITIFSPDFFGNPGQGTYWGYASHWEDHAYLGMVPLLLAITTLYFLVKDLIKKRPFDKKKRVIVFLWGLIVITFIFALGQNTPIFPFLYNHVPTFNMFQAPARYLIWFSIAIPILSAHAAQLWRSPSGKELYWFRLATAGAFAVTLGAGLAVVLLNDIRLTFIISTARSGACTLGFGLLTLIIPVIKNKNGLKIWSWAVLGLTTLDLILAGSLLNPGVNLSFYRKQNFPTQNFTGRLYLPQQEEYDLKFNRFMRFRDYRELEDWSNLRVVTLPNLNLLDQVPMVNNFDPLVPGRFVQWMDALEEKVGTDKLVWLNMMNVSEIETIDLQQLQGVRIGPVEGGFRWRLYSCIHNVNNEDEAWIASQSTSVTSRLVLEGWEGGNQDRCQDRTEVSIESIQESSNRVFIRTRSDIDGWLFSSDIYYPGWKASIDQVEVNLYRANYLFRAVYLPAGEHTVDFFYTPVEFYLGCLSSILGTFVLILTYWLRHKPKIHQ